MNANPRSTELMGLAQALQMLLLDVDGVMTDGGIILIDGDQEAKRFDVQDGMGINIARSAGLKVGIVTSRTSRVVERRAKELSIDELFQGTQRKTDVLDKLVDKYGIDAAQVAYIGDDIQDIPIMERVGIPIAVQNAVLAVKKCSAYVTRANGGHGAIREAVEWLLELRGHENKAYQSLIGGNAGPANG